MQECFRILSIVPSKGYTSTRIRIHAVSHRVKDHMLYTYIHCDKSRLLNHLSSRNRAHQSKDVDVVVST